MRLSTSLGGGAARVGADLLGITFVTMMAMARVMLGIVLYAGIGVVSLVGGVAMIWAVFTGFFLLVTWDVDWLIRCIESIAVASVMLVTLGYISHLRSLWHDRNTMVSNRALRQGRYALELRERD